MSLVAVCDASVDGRRAAFAVVLSDGRAFTHTYRLNHIVSSSATEARAVEYSVHRLHADFVVTDNFSGIKVCSEFQGILARRNTGTAMRAADRLARSALRSKLGQNGPEAVPFPETIDPDEWTIWERLFESQEATGQRFWVERKAGQESTARQMVESGLTSVWFSSKYQLVFQDLELATGSPVRSDNGSQQPEDGYRQS